MSDNEPATQILQRAVAGDPEAARALAPLVYAELRALAASHLSREQVGHSLQPTDLVHEVFVRMLGRDQTWKGRAHFLAVAAVAMRNVLVDHARQRNAAKRDPGGQRVSIASAQLAAVASTDVQVLELNDLLSRLSALDARRGKVAELRIFAGMTHEQIAEALDASRTTIADDWAVAKAWLAAELAEKSR